MGKSRLSPELHRKIVEQCRMGTFRRHAAMAAGVTERTLSNWIRWGTTDDAKEPYRSFAEDLLAAEAFAINNNVLYVQAAATSDWRAASWFLARKAPNEWGDKARRDLKEQLDSILQTVEDVLGTEAATRVFQAIVDRASQEEAPAEGERLEH